jgi:SRSO17 transposase
VTFQTKNELTLAMVQAVVASQTLRCRWFLADEAFGRDTGLLDAIDGLGLWYMVEVPLEAPLWLSEGASATTPKTLFRTLPGSAWTRQLVGDGAKGPRIAEAHVRRVQAGRDGQPGPAVWLILRLDPESGEQKAFLSNAAASLTAARLVTVTGQRWPVEQIFEVGKPQLGMGAYEVRSWPGGHHHMTLVTLAHFFLVRLQHRLKKSPDADAAAGLPAAQRPLTTASAHARGHVGADRLLPPPAYGGRNQSPRTNGTLDCEYGRTHRPPDPVAGPAHQGLSAV